MAKLPAPPMTLTDAEAAALVLETVPRVMASIRREMRAARSSDLTVPQFRLLGFLARRDGASLSDAAEHLGLALPAASKQVQLLVDRGLVQRETSASDRRNLALRVSAAGRAEWKRARDESLRALARQLAALSRDEREHVRATMAALQRVFGAPEVAA
jgi:DNA-binding MarR family transcriptional regulator